MHQSVSAIGAYDSNSSPDVTKLQATADMLTTAVVNLIDQLHVQGPNLESLQESSLKLNEKTKDLELMTRVVKKKHKAVGFRGSITRRPILLVMVVVVATFILAVLASIYSSLQAKNHS
jgi:hypothetical protein